MNGGASGRGSAHAPGEDSALAFCMELEATRAQLAQANSKTKELAAAFGIQALQKEAAIAKQDALRDDMEALRSELDTVGKALAASEWRRREEKKSFKEAAQGLISKMSSLELEIEQGRLRNLRLEAYLEVKALKALNQLSEVL